MVTFWTQIGESMSSIWRAFSDQSSSRIAWKQKRSINSDMFTLKKGLKYLSIACDSHVPNTNTHISVTHKKAFKGIFKVSIQQKYTVN